MKSPREHMEIVNAYEQHSSSVASATHAAHGLELSAAPL
jgi:hypothetical protein